MLIINRLKDKNLLRIILLVTLILYLPGARFFPVLNEETAPAIPQENVENGMGGGIFTEDIPVLPLGVDLELSGLPEPEEYSRPHVLTFSSYAMEKGDIIGNIAIRSGLNEDTLISVNDIKNTRLIQIGQVIRIPNQDGIYYSVKAGDTLESIAEKYSITVSGIKTVNELFSDKIALNASLFIPGAKMDWVNRQEINGDLFIWPCAGYISSNYGYRMSPFDGTTRQFHSGLDIGAAMGAPIKAAMAGRVSQVGYNDSFGNYIIISHHSGYRTLYAHLNTILVRPGATVATGERIGLMGSTGRSTGSHLHFTVFKDGVAVNPRHLMR